MLGDGEKRVGPEVGQGWGVKGACYEAFGDPGGDSIGDMGTEKIGRRGVWAGQGG